MKTILKFLKPGRDFFIWAIILSLFSIFYSVIGMPNPVEIVDYATELFEEYGIVIIFLAAFIEGIFMVNIYFPGSLVLLISVYISDRSFTQLITIGMISLSGFFLSSLLNYFLGYRGVYKILMFLGKKKMIEKMKQRIENNFVKTIFISTFHPNFSAIAVVCCGIVKHSFKKVIVLNTLFTAFWISTWLLVATPFLKAVDVKDEHQDLYIILFLVLIGLFICIKNKVKPSVAMVD